MMVRAKAARGMDSREKGLLFEREVELGCEIYGIEGKALIRKTPEPMKPVRRLKNNQFVAVYTKKAEPDFSGILPGGRSILFEAKVTGAEKIGKDRVTEEQRRKLTAASEMGAVCFVLVKFERSRRVYRVPWEAWEMMETVFGRKYIKESEMSGYAVPVRGTAPLFLTESDLEG